MPTDLTLVQQKRWCEDQALRMGISVHKVMLRLADQYLESGEEQENNDAEKRTV
jgi:hypothetical protein